MRPISCVRLATYGLLSLLLGAASARAEGLRDLLQSPLILGASVSADMGTTSPGKRLALRHTEEKNIEQLAQPGRSARELLPSLREENLAGRSLVIALDLFYWDSVYRNPKRSVEQLKAFVQKCADRKLPLLLGNVPDLMAGKQPGRRALNREIARLCKAPHGCYLVPLAELQAKIDEAIAQSGGFSINGRLYTRRELLPDGLHLSAVAAEYIADGMQAILER